MRRPWKTWNVTLACGIVLTELAGLPLEAQRAKAPSRSHPGQIIPAVSRVWKSETTGKEYRVWIENERFHAEWVNIPPELAQRGAYIRSECRRAGSKWIGTSHSYLPCESVEKNKAVRNWCRLLTRIEIDTVAADRITGRGEGVRRFDCQSCKILERVWKDFQWVPKR